MLFVFAVGRLDGDDVLSGERRGALDVRDLVLLEDKLDAFGVLRAHRSRAFDRNAVVRLDAGDRNAEVGGMTEPSGDRGRFQEGLLPGCIPRERMSLQSFALDNGGGQAELGTPNSAHIPGRAAAKEDYVEGSHVVDGWWLLIAGLEIGGNWSLTPFARNGV